MAYIKLGPIGDYFASARLGIYLSAGNAQQVEDSLLETTLKNFLLTGFFVLIEKHEFENIKIDRRSLNNIPLQYVGVNQVLIVEPVYGILSSPPTQANRGDRYIVWANATGQWEGKENLIAEFNGTDWMFYIPKNGWIVPVYSLGVSAKFIGTYPSGKWLLDAERLALLNETLNNGNQSNDDSEYATINYVDSQIQSESNTRQDQYDYLIQLINSIQVGGIPKAVNIAIDDIGNYFEATNVEMALQELGADLKGLNLDVAQLTSQYLALSSLVQQIINNGGSGGMNTQAIMFSNVDSITYPHQKGRIPVWALYEFTPDGNTTVLPTTLLRGVMAQPYRVTFDEIRFQFPKRYNIVLIIG